jgi:hypothetical protein
MHSDHLKDLIYESSDGGQTVRIRRGDQWDKTKYSQHQLLDLLDLLWASETDSNLKDLLNQAFVYWHLKRP